MLGRVITNSEALVVENSGLGTKIKEVCHWCGYLETFLGSLLEKFAHNGGTVHPREQDVVMS